jgi:hypothetical protein
MAGEIRRIGWPDPEDPANWPCGSTGAGKIDAEMGDGVRLENDGASAETSVHWVPLCTSMLGAMCELDLAVYTDTVTRVFQLRLVVITGPSWTCSVGPYTSLR